jgi:hypothetical protein
MGAALSLRAALERGALVTLATWPVVLVDFGMESLYKTTLAVPVVAGAFMVGVLVGADVRALVADDVQATAELVFASLAGAPAALWSFLAAVGLVAQGGATIMFAVKAGTLAVVAEAERRAGDIPAGGPRVEWLRRARLFDLRRVLGGIRRYGPRMARLAVALGGVYAAIAAAYVAVASAAFDIAADIRWVPVLPVVLIVATSASVVAITAANLACDLLRIVIVTDDCGVRAALGRLGRFLVADARQVLGIFGVKSVVVALAMAASVMAAAGLYLIAWVPVVGLIVVPLQVGAWVARGLVFQYLGLAALAAYLTQYRRFAEPHSQLTTSPVLVQRA